MVRMLCSRSASLMTRTRGSLAMATTILRTVSACAASPNLTLSSLVTPSTSSATWSPKSRRRVSRPYSVSSTVSCSRPGHQGRRVHAELGEDRGDGERVRDVRVAALALLAAVPALGDLVGAARSGAASAVSILGSLLRTIRSSGSRTGLYGLERWTPRRARRARTRLEEPERRGLAARRGRARPRALAPRGGLGRGAGLGRGGSAACRRARTGRARPARGRRRRARASARAGRGLPRRARACAAVSGWASSGKRTPRARSGSPGQAPESPMVAIPRLRIASRPL